MCRDALSCLMLWKMVGDFQTDGEVEMLLMTQASTSKISSNLTVAVTKSNQVSNQVDSLANSHLPSSTDIPIQNTVVVLK